MNWTAGIVMALLWAMLFGPFVRWALGIMAQAEKEEDAWGYTLTGAMALLIVAGGCVATVGAVVIL